MPIFENPHWGLSADRRPIELYASSSEALSGTLSPILFIGGVHGDEPEGVELAEKTLEWLRTEAFAKHWILIPCLNVDGYAENRRTNAQGIDLNRNFPSKNWSAEAKSERYFPGRFPEESPEVKQLVELIKTTRPEVIIHSHSWNPCVVCTGPENHPYAVALSNASGYPLQNDIGYPTPGSLGEFGWKELGIPVICIEEQEKETLSRVWGHFESGIKQIFC